MAKLTGLTSAEVADRQARGLTNQLNSTTSRRLRDIIRANVLTPFNGLITALAVATWLANGNPINSLFFIAMLLNIIVGVAQEVKAKIVLDRLAIMVKPSVKVIRDGHRQTIASSEVVLGDYIVLGLGDQIVADGRILWSGDLEIDESLLTGEADAVAKVVDDEVYSGSFVTSGSGVMEVTKVGEQSYSAKLSTEARQFKRVSSELINATQLDYALDCSCSHCSGANSNYWSVEYWRRLAFGGYPRSSGNSRHDPRGTGAADQHGILTGGVKTGSSKGTSPAIACR